MDFDKKSVKRVIGPFINNEIAVVFIKIISELVQFIITAV